MYSLIWKSQRPKDHETIFAYSCAFFHDSFRYCQLRRRRTRRIDRGNPQKTPDQKEISTSTGNRKRHNAGQNDKSKSHDNTNKNYYTNYNNNTSSISNHKYDFNNCYPKRCKISGSICAGNFYLKCLNGSKQVLFIEIFISDNYVENERQSQCFFPLQYVILKLV